jgi:hypothetical protein
LFDRRAEHADLIDRTAINDAAADQAGRLPPANVRRWLPHERRSWCSCSCLDSRQPMLPGLSGHLISEFFLERELSAAGSVPNHA